MLFGTIFELVSIFQVRANFCKQSTVLRLVRVCNEVTYDLYTNKLILTVNGNSRRMRLDDPSHFTDNSMIALPSKDDTKTAEVHDAEIEEEEIEDDGAPDAPGTGGT